MTQTITDIFGSELAEGDTIAVAFTEGRSAHQRVGKIVGFSERANQDEMTGDGVFHAVPPSPVLVVEWDRNHGHHLPSKPSKIDSLDGRIIKLGDDL